MKFCLFHLMPYAPLDLDFDKKYPSSWMALPNSYYDPKQGHSWVISLASRCSASTSIIRPPMV